MAVVGSTQTLRVIHLYIMSGRFVKELTWLLFLQNLLATATPQDAQQWLHRNRFSPYCRLFANFSGTFCLLTILDENVSKLPGCWNGLDSFFPSLGPGFRFQRTRWIVSTTVALQWTTLATSDTYPRASNWRFVIWHLIDQLSEISIVWENIDLHFNSGPFLRWRHHFHCGEAQCFISSSRCIFPPSKGHSQNEGPWWT